MIGELPARLLRLEGLAVLVGAVALYFHADFGWVLLLVLVLAPDLSMLGYLAGPAVGRRATTRFTRTSCPSRSAWRVS